MGRGADIVIASQAVVRAVAVADRPGGEATDGPALTLASPPSRRAAAIAAPLLWTDSPILAAPPAWTLSRATGEPPIVSSRPSRVTLALRPLPNTWTPCTDCVHDTWRIPATSVQLSL